MSGQFRLAHKVSPGPNTPPRQISGIVLKGATILISFPRNVNSRLSWQITYLSIFALVGSRLFLPDGHTDFFSFITFLSFGQVW